MSKIYFYLLYLLIIIEKFCQAKMLGKCPKNWYSFTGGSFHFKWCKPLHDLSQSLIKVCQVVTIYKIWDTVKWVTLFKQFISYFKEIDTYSKPWLQFDYFRLWEQTRSKKWPTVWKTGLFSSTKALNKVTPWKWGDFVRCCLILLMLLILL